MTPLGDPTIPAVETQLGPMIPILTLTLGEVVSMHIGAFVKNCLRARNNHR